MKAEEEEEENVNDGEPEFPPLYTGTAEDFEKASDAKQDAADLQSNGDWEGALSKYNEAVLAAPPSALLYANRAKALLKLGRSRAAERDCDLALQENPDSAKVKKEVHLCIFVVVAVSMLVYRNTCILNILFVAF
jgi:suppressor of tumorigenicity protein 13